MKKTFSFIVFSFVSMSLQAQESYKYPKKMAFVIGADHSTAHAGREETYIRDNNITSTQSLTKNGYQVHNFFGNSKNAADLRQKANKSFVKPFTIENVKESLNSIYKADCENRPEQLMIDMNAHGSRFLGKAEKHSINTVDEAGQTVRIPVGDIANHIKSLQTSSCPRPKIAVIDSSCKAGGSIAEFQDLGCVMTASSISGSTRVVAAKEIYQSVGRLGGQGLDQVHLEATLNPEYGLLKEEYKGVGDVVLTKSLVNDNQIGGCEDQKFFNYEQHGDYAKVKEIVPVCHVGYLFYNEKLDHEIDSVSDILKKYNSTNDVDQETIAKVMKKKKEDIPAASDIWDSIKKIEEKNGEISLKTKDLLVEESKLISKVQNKSIPCDLAGQATTHDERSIINDKSKLEGHMSSFCAMNYKEDSEEFKTCMVMKNYKKITLKSTDLFKYHHHGEY